MNIDKYKLCLAQQQAGIARYLKDENGWSEANETLKTAYGVQHERKAETRKTADIHPTSRVWNDKWANRRLSFPVENESIDGAHKSDSAWN
nr:hypothetical protein [Providencia rettgeri]